MRDNNKGMIELVHAFEKDDAYFCVVEVPKDSQRRKFQFGVTRAGYLALKRIFSSRPLTNMPGIKYRYFWNGSMGGKTENSIFFGIRCEAQKQAKSFDFEIPHSLAANLVWFSGLKDLDEAHYLQLP
ncbi:MAG: hypothetical protein JW936_01335 [Sedimentisphaerales bacterium]|nr:hypothetical protein [Sedimentisphaerales bacterium]